MFVVLVGGYPNQRSEFLALASQNENIMWINDQLAFYYIGHLFIHFGGPTSIPRGKLTITWSGDHQETLDRVYKTLGV
jgi:hypothetical protein